MADNTPEVAQDDPETVTVKIDPNGRPLSVSVFFGGTDLITYDVNLADSEYEFGSKIGSDDNLKFDSADIFPVPAGPLQLQGKCINVWAVFLDPRAGGSVDSYTARFDIKQGGELAGSAKWVGRLNGQREDTRVFIVKFD